MTTPTTPDLAPIEARAAALSIARLREALPTLAKHDELVDVESADLRVVIAHITALRADNERLREVLGREADAHESDVIAVWRALENDHEPPSDVGEVTAAITTLRAQHAADVAAAVAAASRSTRESCAATLRARAECLRRYAYEATAKADATEYTHDASEVDACAAIVASVAIAAPTGGGE